KRSQRSNGSPTADQHAEAGEGDQHGTAGEEHEETRETDSPDEEPKPPKRAASLKNAVQIIQNLNLVDVHFDTFLQRLMTGSREWADADDRELAIRLQSEPGFAKIGLDIVRQAALTVAYRRSRNCAKDWLDTLEWDQESRIDRFF